MEEEMSSKFHPARLLILAFIVVRLILNLQPRPLSIFFVIMYALLGSWFFVKWKNFTKVFIGFLVLDSLIGTYLAFASVGFDVLYIGTMGVNILFIIILLMFRRVFEE